MKLILILATVSLLTFRICAQRIYVYDKEKKSLIVEIHEKAEEKPPKNHMKDLVLDYDPSKKLNAKKVEKKEPKAKKKIVKNTEQKKKDPENKPVLVKGKTIQPSEAFSLRNNDSYIDALTPIGSADYNPGDIYKVQ